MENIFAKRRARLLAMKAMRENYVPGEKLVTCPHCGGESQRKGRGGGAVRLPLCGYHFPMGAYYRLSSVLDPGSFRELHEKLTASDPLRFPGYGAKLDGARRKTGMNEAVVTATGTVGGSRCVVGVLDSRFFMGSMSAAVGEKLTLAIEYAGKNKLPLILFAASGGARMQEGILSSCRWRNQHGAGPVRGKGTAVHLRSHRPHHRRRHRQLCLVRETLFWPNPVRLSASPGLASFSRPSARPCRRAFSGRSFRWSTALWMRWSPEGSAGHPHPSAEAPRERRTPWLRKPPRSGGAGPPSPAAQYHGLYRRTVHRFL